MDNHAAFVRALAYGIGAAVAGLVGYALIAILLQGWVISYMSIGVGWIVGTAMIKGSNGVGGRRYQIAAAAADLCGRFNGGDSHLDSLRLRPAPAKTSAGSKVCGRRAQVRKRSRTAANRRATRSQSAKTSDELCDVAGNGGIARSGVSVHSAFGQSLVGGHWPVNSFLGDQDRVENNCRPTV